MNDSSTLCGTIDLLTVASSGFGEDRWLHVGILLSFSSDVVQLIYGRQMTTNLLTSSAGRRVESDLGKISRELWTVVEDAETISVLPI